MRVVVTGATGFIGRPLVQRLLAQGHEVVALTRDVERAARRLPLRCACERWDAAPGFREVPALRGADAVIHLAGESVAAGRWTAGRKIAIRDSRVHGTRQLVAAIAALPERTRPGTLVAASAIGYYGDRGDEELDEQSPPGQGFLADVCRAWEQEIDVARAAGVRTVAVRTGLVLGTHGGAFARMLLPFRLGVGGRLGSGRQWTSWIHLDDLVGLLAFAVENPAVTEVVAAVAPAPVTNAEFTRQLGAALGRPTIFPVPASVLRLALGEMSTLLLDSQRVQPRAATRLGFRFRYARLPDALADLCADFAETLVFEQGVACPPDEVFPFFADARNLEKITPPRLRFRVLRVTPPEMRVGTLVDYRLSLRGIPFRWQSRIDEWQPNLRFVDSQVRGPYKSWRHTHEFEPHDGGTLVRDTVRYELPFGAVGALLAGWLVARDLETIFAFRHDTIGALFGRLAGP